MHEPVEHGEIAYLGDSAAGAKQRDLEETGHYRPQYEIVAERLVTWITAAQLKAGDRLPSEQRLGEHLGVSRSIVREAIKALAATGLLGVRKGVGVYVSGGAGVLNAVAHNVRGTIDLSMPVDPEHMEALFDFRALQEGLTARLAPERITLMELRELERQVAQNRHDAEIGNLEAFLATDSAFHTALAQATHNPFLVETVTSVLRLQRWAVRLVTGGAPGSLVSSANQHIAIFDAIRTGDGMMAERAMLAHIMSVKTAYQQAVRRLLDEALVRGEHSE